MFGVSTRLPSFALTPLACVALALSGCYATRVVPAAEVGRLSQGDNPDEIVVIDGFRGERLTPSSWVRFRRDDGSATAWFRAAELRVSPTAIVLPPPARAGAGPARAEVLRWEQLRILEINNLDLPLTAAGVTAGSGLVAVALTTEVVLMLTSLVIFRDAPSDGLGLTSAALRVTGAEAFRRPEEDPTATMLVSARAAVADDAVVADARPLFTGRARRRDRLLLVMSSEVGFDVAAPRAPLPAVTAGVRLGQVLELGAGVRLMRQVGGGVGSADALLAVPFGRVGLHLDLDAARRLALAVEGEVGGAPGVLEAQLGYGLRLRLSRGWQVGLYPMNLSASSQTRADGTQRPMRGAVNRFEIAWLF